MKTTKKIFAAVLAVMMIALMIPFSASAAESYSATYKLAVDANDTDKVGNYTFSFFKIANLNLQQVSTHVLSPTKHLRML